MSVIKEILGIWRSERKDVGYNPYPPVVTLPEPPKPEPNWVKQYSDYTRRIVCHCGNVMPHPDMGCAMGEVCLKCGCTDQYFDEIGRFEYEQDVNHILTAHEILMAPYPRHCWPDCRNARWVKKPDVCPHKGDE